MILQDTLNPEGILYFKNVMDADILRSVVEGRSSIINYFYVFFKRSRETVFSTNKRVTAGREGAATHVAVVGHYAAMMLSAGCSDATGFPFPNNQPGTLMMLNSGCHLRKEKKIQRQVCKFHVLEHDIRKSRPMGEKADVCSLLSSTHTPLL